MSENTENEETSKNEETKKNDPAPALPENLKFAVGEKKGMTRLFDEEGNLNSATIIDLSFCKVAYVRSEERDGYRAVALGFGEAKEKNLAKAKAGIFKKTGISAPKRVTEFRLSPGDSLDGVEPGQEVSAGRFKKGDFINARGISKGKGFAGVMKRYNFRGGPASHGASDRERAPGSISARRVLGRVLPGKKMPGHMGGRTVTVEKVKVLKTEGSVVYVGGSVPGTKGSLIYLMPTSKCRPAAPKRTSNVKKK